MKLKSKIIKEENPAPKADWVADNITKPIVALLLLAFLLFIIYQGIAMQKAHAEYPMFILPTRAIQELEFGTRLTSKLQTFKKHSVNAGEQYKSVRASYAYKYSDWDKDFVLTMNAECGSWACGLHDLKYLRDGELWSDFGLCGISTYYHTELYTKVKDGTWQDQVHACYDLYKKGTRFYGYDHRIARGKNLIFNQ